MDRGGPSRGPLGGSKLDFIDLSSEEDEDDGGQKVGGGEGRGGD